MRIISWNTNGLRATAKQGYLMPLFSFLNPDVLCLQETKVEVEQLDDNVKNIKGYQSYFASSKVKKGYSGVGIYTRIVPDDVEYGFGIPEFDDEGRTIIAYFGNTMLINCYFPNGGGGPHRLDYKMRFYDSFLSFIEVKKKKGFSVIFCGDVNTAHEAIDLARPKENEENTGFLPEERAWIDEVVAHGYVDVFRYKNPSLEGAYTYWDMKTRARDRNVGWRIDYFFVSNDIVNHVKKVSIENTYLGSDHCPLVMDIEIKK